MFGLRIKWYKLIPAFEITVLTVVVAFCGLFCFFVPVRAIFPVAIAGSLFLAAQALILFLKRDGVLKAVLLTVISLVTAVVMFFFLFLLAAFPDAASYMPWQYSFMNDYAFDEIDPRYDNDPVIPDYFPESIPSSARHYRYIFENALYNAPGEIYVAFEADDGYVAELEEKLSGYPSYTGTAECSSMPATAVWFWIKPEISSAHQSGTAYITEEDHGMVFIDGNFVLFGYYTF